mmetsp:Transcript_32897/g.59331  ORF Transcript_32897/g.59331 Transcript_32897/m.59331 type:complete len:327 (+) Transcript_32897:111-1091(+)
MQESHHRRRLQSEGLKCSETTEREDALTFVIFHCNLPGPLNTELEFNCREPSCGALEGDEKAAKLADDDYTVDPNFFDEGYSMAGATGFKVWTGSRLLIETLAWPQSDDCERLKEIQKVISSGAQLIELGSGVGVVGTYLSAIGSQVLLTDLPTLVENAIDCNLLRNKKIPASIPILSSDENACPSWLAPDGMRIGKGWANSTSLDWTFPLDEQLTKDQSSSIDFIIASDVVFLASMLTSLLNTVQSLFNASSSNNPSFILSFQRRDAKDGEESATFTTVNGVIAAVEKRGWSLDCLAWRPVTVRKEADGAVIDDESEVFVFEIKP